MNKSLPIVLSEVNQPKTFIFNNNKTIEKHNTTSQLKCKNIVIQNFVAV